MLHPTVPTVLERMPKAELHVHLEGTISPETLWAMAKRNQVTLPVGSLAELRALYSFESFAKFVDLWLAMCACLRTPSDYEQMVDGFVAECSRQNVGYVEAHFTPYNHERFGFGGYRALEIVTKRLLASETAGGPVVRLITDIPSESLPRSGSFTAELFEAESHPLVVAIGLGGPEAGFPRTLAAPFFERARRAGYPTVAHAGETGDAEHVRQAVLDLGVRRVQHGVAAVEDEPTLRLLAERGICCDVALSSNECLTVYKDVKAHPIRRLIAAGVPVTLGSDDPPFFGTSLNREYARAHQEVGLSVEELWRINLNGLRHALVDEATRDRLARVFAEKGGALGLYTSASPEERS